MLNKNNRLKKKKEFSYVYKRGMSHANNLFVVYVVPTKYAESKFGISVSAKVGKSFVRSRVKRVLSEAIRLTKSKSTTMCLLLALKWLTQIFTLRKTFYFQVLESGVCCVKSYNLSNLPYMCSIYVFI